MKKAFLLLAGAAACVSPAAARAPVELAPLTPWNLHYADNSCQLARTFGDAANPTTLVFNRLLPTSDMTLMVFGGGLRARQGSGEAKASFLPFPEHEFVTLGVAETVDKRVPAIMWTGINLLPGYQHSEYKPGVRTPRNPAEVEALRALEAGTAGKVTALQVREPSGRRLVLKTGSLGRALALMRDCGKEQLARWGFDPAVTERILYPARSQRSLADLFDSSDYPRKALFFGNEAIVSARLHVGTDGKVTRCVSLTPYKEPAFGEVVCRNLSKAAFDPAELADGTRVPDVVVANILFRMEQ